MKSTAILANECRHYAGVSNLRKKINLQLNPYIIIEQFHIKRKIQFLILKMEIIFVKLWA